MTHKGWRVVKPQLNQSILIPLSYLLYFLFYLFSPFLRKTTLNDPQGLACHKPQHMPASVAQLDAPSHWRPAGHSSTPCQGQQHSFVEIDHEIFSMVILSLPLIQEGQLSVSGKRMYTILVNRLED